MKGDEITFYKLFLRKFEGDARERLDKNTIGKDQCRICGEWDHWGNECPKRFNISALEGPKEDPFTIGDLLRETSSAVDIKVEDFEPTEKIVEIEDKPTNKGYQPYPW